MCVHVIEETHGFAFLGTHHQARTGSLQDVGALDRDQHALQPQNRDVIRASNATLT